MATGLPTLGVTLVSRIVKAVNGTLGVMLNTVVLPLPLVVNVNALLNVASSLSRFVFCESDNVVMFFIVTAPLAFHVILPPATYPEPSKRNKDFA